MKIEIVTTLKREATRILSDLHQTSEPVLITEHGKASAYLIDAADYDSMQNRILILEGLAKGEKAIRETRVISHDKANKKMKTYLI